MGSEEELVAVYFPRAIHYRASSFKYSHARFLSQVLNCSKLPLVKITWTAGKLSCISDTGAVLLLEASHVAQGQKWLDMLKKLSY